MRLEKRDILLLILATLLAVAGLGPDDPWVVGPCLFLSWVTFMVIIVIHEGSRLARAIVGIAITVALSGVGYRRFNSIYHSEKVETKTKNEAALQILGPELLRPPMPNMGTYVNVNFQNMGGEIITYRQAWGVVLLPLPADWESNQEAYENNIWSSTMAQLMRETTTFQAMPHRPMVTTLVSRKLSPGDVENIKQMKTALYFTTVFSYQDDKGTHEANFCGYILGTGLLHQYHRHNT